MFPPASLPGEIALENYRHHRTLDHAWMLGRFVISAQEIDKLAPAQDVPWAVLTNSDHSMASAIESKLVISTAKPTYCEVPIDQLEAVKEARSFAKLRTGGVTPDAIPSTEYLSHFITRCARLRLPFKATAGLHHPVRSEHRLTYENDSASAMMHGFVNVFLAAAFAWQGERQIEYILAETDPAAFRFDEAAHWRDRSLTKTQIAQARSGFAHSFGSCSFAEPVHDLESLQWL